MKNIKYTLDGNKLRHMIIAGKSRIKVVEKAVQIGKEKVAEDSVEAGI